MSDKSTKLPAVRGGNPPEAFRFKPGQSGNPGGRGSKATEAVRKAKSIAARYAPAALRLLVSQVYDEKLDPKVRQSASIALAAYTISKASQSIELTGEGGSAIKVASINLDEVLKLDVAAITARLSAITNSLAALPSDTDAIDAVFSEQPSEGEKP